MSHQIAIHHNIGVVAYHLRQWEEALSSLEKAVEISSKFEAVLESHNSCITKTRKYLDSMTSSQSKERSWDLSFFPESSLNRKEPIVELIQVLSVDSD